jgi:hypothetical protein
MPCISDDSSTREILAYSIFTDEQSPLDEDNREEDPECPESWYPYVRILYPTDSTSCYLDHCEYEEDRYGESRHWFSLAMTVGMIGVSRFLSVSHAEIDDR